MEEEAFVSTAECGATAETVAEAVCAFITGCEAIADCVVAPANVSTAFEGSTVRFAEVLAIVEVESRSPNAFHAVSKRK